MGLDINGTQFLLHAKAQGADFSRTAMIGRQGLYLKPADFRALLARFGVAWSDEVIAQVFTETQGYAEALLRRLGAEEAHSVDYSSYEGATHVHDMNTPVPAAWKEQYSLVVDGGSLEHVFNFPAAIRNCMEMVRAGGHYLGMTPANNFLGHGFYQFSPELFFRIFTPQNGFELTRVIAVEDTLRARWYEVSDPAKVGKRVMLMNRRPTTLLVMAKRTEVRPLFENPPQQSDYATLWNTQTQGSAQATGLAAELWRALPQRARDAIKQILWSGRDPRFFRRMDPAAFKGQQALNPR